MKGPALVLILALLPALSWGASVVSVIRIEGPIGPVAAEYLQTNLSQAEVDEAQCLIVELDTPGGLDASMRLMVKSILNASIPVVVYVCPSGARAASAGMMITLAAHVAAMAPGTNIGAAHPVTMGGKKLSEEMQKKLENDAAAYVRSIAARRGRNAKWAERAVRESVSATAQEALKLGVIDLIALDLGDLLRKLDGRKVVTVGGERTLRTRGAQVRRYALGMRGRILSALSNPNVVYLLLMLGMAGLYFELAHPGAILPGVVGAICLILAFYSLQTLPVNYAGVLLIILGVVLLIAEAKVAGYGLLGVGGVISMLLGSLMLFSSPLPWMRLSWKVVVPTVVLTGGLLFLSAGLVFRAQRRRPLTGVEGLVGEEGVAITDLQPEGKVLVHGEYWNARAETPVRRGGRVKVVQVGGRFRLRVVEEEDE